MTQLRGDALLRFATRMILPLALASCFRSVESQPREASPPSTARCPLCVATFDSAGEYDKSDLPAGHVDSPTCGSTGQACCLQTPARCLGKDLYCFGPQDPSTKDKDLVCRKRSSTTSSQAKLTETALALKAEPPSSQPTEPTTKLCRLCTPTYNEAGEYDDSDVPPGHSEKPDCGSVGKECCLKSARRCRGKRVFCEPEEHNGYVRQE
jgi:hypothetical protein